MQPFVNAQGLTRYYGRTVGIDQVSLQINKGEVLALLGANGAGKSTTIRTLAGIQTPAYGTIQIDGIDLLKNPRKAQPLIGYLPDKPALFRHMKVRAFLQCCARLRGVDSAHALQASQSVIECCRLESVQHRIIQNLSKGYQQRVALAQALIHRPTLLLLDEPTTGLDPAQIIHLREIVAEYRKTTAILLSTHQLPEVEQMADRVLILSNGRTVFENSLTELRRHQPLRIRFGARVEQTALEQIAQVESVCMVSPHEFLIDCVNPDNTAQLLIRTANERHWPLLEIHQQQSSIEKLFIEKTASI